MRPGFLFERHSVRARLMAWNMLTLAALLILVGAVAQHLVRSIMLASVDRELVKRAQRLAEHPNLPPEPGSRPQGDEPQPGGPPAPREPVDPTRSDAGFDRPQVIDLQGRVLRPPDATTPWDANAFRLAAHGRRVLSTVIVQGYPMRVISAPYPPNGPPAGVVQVPYPLTEMNRAIGGLNRALLVLLPFAMLGAGLGGAFLTRRALHPVRQIAQVAERIGTAGLSERLPLAGKDEFWELAGVINGMLDRLQEMVERERQFTADASHELRTPVAIIKANTSLCLSGEPSPAHYRRSVEAIDRAADSMDRLVQDLLLLARSDAGRLARHPVVLLLGDVLQQAARRVSRPEQAPIRLVVPDPALCVVGDEEELVRLFTNLLENAAHCTPADGTITVSAEALGSQVRVSVADTGVGIAPEHLPRLGERFYRVDAARSRPEGGTGLGLSICRSIVAAHGGEMTIESVLGQGTTVRVSLPAADAPPTDGG